MVFNTQDYGETSNLNRVLKLNAVVFTFHLGLAISKYLGTTKFELVELDILLFLLMAACNLLVMWTNSAVIQDGATSPRAFIDDIEPIYSGEYKETHLLVDPDSSPSECSSLDSSEDKVRLPEMKTPQPVGKRKMPETPRQTKESITEKVYITCNLPNGTKKRIVVRKIKDKFMPTNSPGELFKNKIYLNRRQATNAS